MMDAISASIRPTSPGYDSVFSIQRSTGTWRSLEGSNPYNGKVGDITVADEMTLSFDVFKWDLKNVIRAMVECHPYEEPAISITRLIDWKRFV